MVAVGFAAFFLYVKFVVQPQAGDVSSGVPCQEGPPLAEVEQALQQQAALVEWLEAIGDVTVLPTSCGEETDSRGEIMIFVPSKSVSDAVQEVLESDYRCHQPHEPRRTRGAINRMTHNPSVALLTGEAQRRSTEAASTASTTRSTVMPSSRWASPAGADKPN